MSKAIKRIAAFICAFGLSAGYVRAEQQAAPKMALIPSGAFEMGDHHGFVDPKHGSDETPLHTVRLDAFQIGVNDVTTQEYCEFLNAALAQRQIEVRKGEVYLTGGSDLLCDTRESSPSSEVGWEGTRFSVLDKKESHPMVCVRWHGAAAYCNWLSAQKRLPVCYDTKTWACNFNASGFRLPTEAEWEYAARGGQKNPYFKYPWGDDADPLKANVPQSRNPFRVSQRTETPPAGYRQSDGPGGEAWRTGALPLTTPVGFFNGSLRRKADFGWPGGQETFQTANGANAFGLYDMCGNVWQWCAEWYERNYYAYSPAENPPGPAQGSPMPDGKAYRCMRGGSWFNGEFGHGRVSNRDPSFYRGPDPVTGLSDADGPWFHIGFRVILPVNAEGRPAIKPTPVQNGARNDSAPGDRPLRQPSQPGGERKSGFVLSSPEVTDGGTLPKEFTGDGASATLPLEWRGSPAGTRSYALIMHHIPGPGSVKWYWILYDIPANVQSLPKNVKGVGTLGNNSVNDRREYAPPHSKGPGAKTYIYTVYALSAPPQFSVPPAQVNREVLLAAMEGKILASAELRTTYTRYTLGGAEQGPGEGPRPPPPREGGRNRDGDRADRPPRPDNQDMDLRPDRPEGQREREGQGVGPQRGGGGGRIAENNKTPESPNPGQTIGLFLNTPKAFNGYTLFAPKHNTVTYLMDNQGRAVHQWQSAYEPGQTAYLLTNGHLLRAGMIKVPGGTGGGEGGRIEEYTWEGQLVWGFDYATRDYQLHHDIKPLPNGHVLALMVERKSRAEAVAAGFDPGLLRDGYLVPDAVVEIEPVRPKGGRIVWEWHVWDHLLHNADAAAHPELIDPAGAGRGIPAFWNHMNSLDYNPALDQIVLSVRGNNEIWIIDHSASTAESAGHTGGRSGKGGDLLYRWGNPAAYRRGMAADRQLIQQHDAQWIPAGCPGAGHITVFNNGYERGWSSIEEIVPPLESGGCYTLAAGQAFGPDKPVWHYQATNRTDFFSSEISGAHRLPNGNTLICAGVIGHLFEVTPQGETVWQYVNPMVRDGILAQGEVPGKDARGHLWNAVFKAHRYAPDYPGLVGRELKPVGVIERPAAEKGKTGLDRLPVEKLKPVPEVLRNLRSLGYMR